MYTVGVDHRRRPFHKICIIYARAGHSRFLSLNPFPGLALYAPIVPTYNTTHMYTTLARHAYGFIFLVITLFFRPPEQIQFELVSVMRRLRYVMIKMRIISYIIITVVHPQI